MRSRTVWPRPSRKRPSKLSILAIIRQEFLLKSWWVIGFILLVFCVFHPIFKNQNREQLKLSMQLRQLQFEKESAINRKSHLNFQIESQTDPAWVEMILKKELGMVSEGQTKVHFLTQ